MPYRGGTRLAPFTQTFDPRSVPGLALWLRAKTIGGGTLAAWPDVSGNGRHATQATGGSQPLWVGGVTPRGGPVVRFDGVDDYLVLPDFASGFTSGEIFIVIKITNDPAGSGGTSAIWGMGTSVNYTHFPFTDGNIYDAWGSNVRKTVGDPALSLSSTFRLYNVSSANNDWTARLDGSQIFNTTSNTVAFRSAPELGSDFDGSSRIYLSGDIAEVFMYRVIPTPGDRARLNQYAAAEHGLTDIAL